MIEGQLAKTEAVFWCDILGFVSVFPCRFDRMDGAPESSTFAKAVQHLIAFSVSQRLQLLQIDGTLAGHRSQTGRVHGCDSLTQFTSQNRGRARSIDTDSHDILPDLKNNDLDVIVDEQALVRLAREHKHWLHPFWWLKD